MRIAIYGLGYVGLTGAICLASECHEVVGVDVSEDKVRRIMAGSSPIKEPGLDKMLADALAKGRLRCTTDAAIPCGLWRSRSSVSGRRAPRMAPTTCATSPK